MLALAIACGGSGKAVEPPLALPPLDPRLKAAGYGSLKLDIAPASGQIIEPEALAAKLGAAPSCATFVFLFSWRATDAGSLSFRGTRSDVEFDVGRGAKGQASLNGCSIIEAVNPSGKRMTGDISYIIAEIQP